MTPIDPIYCSHSLELKFWATVSKTVRPVLSDRCPVLSVRLYVLSVTLVYCGQTVKLGNAGRPRHLDPSSRLATVRLATVDIWAEKWGGAVPRCSTVRPGPSVTSTPSGIWIHTAVWPQQTWAENWGGLLCPFWRGELWGSHLTQCGHGRGPPPYQVTSCPCRCLDTTDMCRKFSGCCAPFVVGAESHLTECGLGRGLYLPTKWHLDPSSNLATTAMGRKLGSCASVQSVAAGAGSHISHITQCDHCWLECPAGICEVSSFHSFVPLCHTFQLDQLHLTTLRSLQ